MKVRSLVLFIFCSACTCGVGVVTLYSKLEDSPYHFNLGIQAPAGIYLDITNRLSLSWDIVVLGSVITPFAVAASVLFLFKLMEVVDVVRWRGAFRRVQMSALVAALATDVSAVVAIVWGIFAYQDAPYLFNHVSVSASYLTVGSWLPLVTLMAIAAFVASHAVIRSGQHPIFQLKKENISLSQKRKL